MLCILDGWGLGEGSKDNAIFNAKKENYDLIEKKYGHVKLEASEEGVGLPSGQFGNSEVGHMNIGAGRIILQDILRISESFANGYFSNNINIKKVVKETNRIHLVGLISDGGVHGHQDHLFEMIKIFNTNKNKIFIHCFLDGRDSSPISGLENLKKLTKFIEKMNNVDIVSISGRFFSMDRDNRWDRIKLAYKAIIEGSQPQYEDPIKAIQESYNKNITDEFFKPINLKNYSGVQDNDGFFITNFRADRVRELLSSIFDQNFDSFERKKIAKFLMPLSMVEYSKRLRKFLTPILDVQKIKNNLGETLSKKKITQLRIAETEKYAHVTYFFNGGNEDSFDYEDRVLIPSPRIDTYDKKPEMSATELTNELIKRIKIKKYDFIVANYANPDMVGHSGNYRATVKAVETVDKCLGKIIEQCQKENYLLVVTSDHGNADKMFDYEKDIPCTTHTINKVPFIICENIQFVKKIGKLADIAPTVLKLLGIKKPKEMKGNSLIK